MSPSCRLRKKAAGPPPPPEEREQLLDADPGFAQDLHSFTGDPNATDADLPPDDATDSDWPAGVTRAELEALNAIETDTDSHPKQPTWHRTLPLNRPVPARARSGSLRLGGARGPAHLTPCHAGVERLRADRHAAQRAAGDSHPAGKHNLGLHNKPVEQCTVRPDEWFVIGRTQFTLHLTAGEVEPASDATVYLSNSGSESHGSRLDPTAVLRAVERLQRTIQLNPDLPQSFWQALLAAVMEALPRTDLASVIHIPKDAQSQHRTLLDRITTVESTTQPSQSRRLQVPLLNGELVHNAVNVHRRSCSELSAPRGGPRRRPLRSGGRERRRAGARPHRRARAAGPAAAETEYWRRPGHAPPAAPR